MTYKKTWISCLLWAVFTCITGVLLADYTISFWIQEIDTSVGAGTVILVAVVFVLAAIGCILLREIYNKTANRYKVSAGKINILENLVFFLIFITGLFYRIELYLHYSLDQIAETSYFELATVTAGKASVDLIKNIADLYTVCLSFTLSFLGNKLIAGVWMQIFFQMLTILLGFFLLRKMIGKVPAYATALFLTFSPAYTGQIFCMTPEVFSFFVFLLALFIIGSYVKNYSLDAYSAQGLIFSALICGCIIGFLTYLDIVFLTLLVIPAGLTGIVCAKEEDAPVSKVLPVFLFVLIVSTAGLVLMGLFAFEAYTLKGTIVASAQSWISSYVHLPAYVPHMTEISVTECMILVFPASFLIMSFWFRHKVQNASQWMAFMLLFGAPHMTSGVTEYKIYSLFIWSVLAGIGLQQCFTRKKTIMHAVGPEPITPIPESTDEPLSEPQPEPMAEPPIPENTETISEMQTEPMETEMKITSTEEKETTQVQDVPAKPRFIENPLPLPKKHEKRSLDYQYEVDETKLEFDVEIAENDDFDV